MVDILNLRTSPQGATSPVREQAEAAEAEAAVTSPPTSTLKDSIIQGLKSTTVQVPGDSEEDLRWSYTKTIPTSTSVEPCHPVSQILKCIWLQWFSMIIKVSELELRSALQYARAFRSSRKAVPSYTVYLPYICDGCYSRPLAESSPR